MPNSMTALICILKMWGLCVFPYLSINLAIYQFAVQFNQAINKHGRTNLLRTRRSPTIIPFANFNLCQIVFYLPANSTPEFLPFLLFFRLPFYDTP